MSLHTNSCKYIKLYVLCVNFILSINRYVYCIVYRSEQTNNNAIAMLLHQLKTLEEEKKQADLKIAQFSKEIVQLKKNFKEMLANNAKAIANLSEKNEELQKNLAETRKTDSEIASDTLRIVFTLGQIRKLTSSKNKRIRWSAEDISSAIALRSLSSRAYNYLREAKNFPLPCVQTLRNWITKFSVQPGILKDVLEIMANKAHQLSKLEKLIVLCFDELYISNKVDLERRQQKIYGPHKTSQFIMTRSLFGNWKQPIFYDFDKPMTKEILMEVITRLNQIRYTVVAVTSDLGPTNARLWKNMNIGVVLPISAQKISQIQWKNRLIKDASLYIHVMQIKKCLYLPTCLT